MPIQSIDDKGGSISATATAPASLEAPVSFYAKTGPTRAWFSGQFKQEFLIVCESAIRSQEGNNLYLLGIFETINTSSETFPVIHPQFTVVTKITGGDENEHAYLTRVRKETGEEIGTLRGKFRFGQNGKVQLIHRFIGFPFPNLGKYIIEVFVDSDQLPIVGEIGVKRRQV